jgi:hypothetical protein
VQSRVLATRRASQVAFSIARESRRDINHFAINGQKGRMFKPFKPPLLKSAAKPASIDLTESDDEPQPRPFKKRKLLIHVVEDSPPPAKTHASSVVLAPRKPLLLVKNPTELNSTQDPSAERPEGYYIVLWYDINALPSLQVI